MVKFTSQLIIYTLTILFISDCIVIITMLESVLNQALLATKFTADLVKFKVHLVV